MINRFFDIKNCPVSTMTTKFFENSKINFTIQQINQLNYNFLSMDLSTSAHAMTSLLSSWKHGADTMSALLSSPSSNHLPLSRDEVESIHNDETIVGEHCAYQHGGVASVLADTQRAGFKGQRPFTTSNILLFSIFFTDDTVILYNRQRVRTIPPSLFQCTGEQDRSIVFFV